MSAKAETVKDPRGLKRICTQCGTRFYDLNKRPAICPSCSTEFTGETKIKTRRSRAAIATEGQVEEKAAADVSNDDTQDEKNEDAAVIEKADDADVVSLDDVEEKNDDAEGEDELADPDLDLDPLEDDVEEDDLEGLEGDVDLGKAPSKGDE